MVEAWAVLGGGAIVYAMLAFYSMHQRAARRRLDHVRSRRLGVSGGRFSTEVGALHTFDGRDATLHWEEGSGSLGERIIHRLTMTLGVPELAAFEAGYDVPSDPARQLYSWGGPLRGYRVLGGEGAGDVLAWFPASFGEAVLEVFDDRTTWSNVVLEEGRLILNLVFLEGRRVDDVVHMAEPLLEHAGRLLAAIPDDPDLAGRLAARARSRDECSEVNWRATRALIARHASSPWLEQLYEGVAGLPEYTRLAVAVWGRPEAFASDTRLNLLEQAQRRYLFPELSRAALAAQRGGYAWRMLMDPGLPHGDRLEAARFALGSDDAPAEERAREVALLDLFTNDQFPSQAALYHALSGWSPSTPARVRLVELAYAGLREAMIEELRARALTPDDAPVVAALARRGDDVDDLVGALRDAGVHAIGQLSLAGDDAARGGLTEAAGAGGLSPADEEV